MLESIPRARRATAVAGVEAECARGVLAHLCRRFGCEQGTDGIECTDITGRIRAGRAPDRALIDHHDVIDQLSTAQPRKFTRRLCWLTPVLEQGGIQDILDQRRLA